MLQPDQTRLFHQTTYEYEDVSEDWLKKNGQFYTVGKIFKWSKIVHIGPKC